MTQPGSLRDSAVSFSKSAATSDSRPAFAIHVTASTTIRRSVLALAVVLRSDSGRRALDWLKAQLAHKIRHEDRLLAIRAGGNHSNSRSGFLLDECQVLTGGLG